MNIFLGNPQIQIFNNSFTPTTRLNQDFDFRTPKLPSLAKTPRHSKTAFSKASSLLENRVLKLKSDINHLQRSRLEITQRAKSINKLQREFKIKFSRSKIERLSLHSLRARAEILAKKREQRQAAVKIQSWWKKMSLSLYSKEIQGLMNSAASIIQRVWHGYMQRKHTQILVEQNTKNLKFLAQFFLLCRDKSLIKELKCEK